MGVATVSPALAASSQAAASRVQPCLAELLQGLWVPDLLILTTACPARANGMLTAGFVSPHRPKPHAPDDSHRSQEPFCPPFHTVAWPITHNGRPLIVLGRRRGAGTGPGRHRPLRDGPLVRVELLRHCLRHGRCVGARCAARHRGCSA